MARKDPKKKKKKGNSDQILTGTLDITRSGIGFVIVDKVDKDIMVRPSDFNTALHGDTVRVEVPGNSAARGRQQGKVTEVIKRKQLEFAGKLQMGNNFAFFIPEVEKPMPDIYIPLDKLNNATENDLVVVRIIEWEKNKKPVGEVMQILDAGSAGDRAMKSLLMEAGFPLVFQDEVREEALRIPDLIPA
ncbi:MAG: ribonuclease R, partial [Flavitalea sp.]